MTQLLISVKNLEEALLALDAGVDVIDLKDPNIGALGALDMITTAQIVRTLDGRALLSATVGEGHATLNALLRDIQLRAELGVDIIKICVSHLFDGPQFFTEMHKLTRDGIKIVVIFFADKEIDLDFLPKCHQAGFYGAMLDTQEKHFSLLENQSTEILKEFVRLCHENQLNSGLAGSVKPQYIDSLLEINPTFIGMRGGVCENHMRKSALVANKIIEAKNMLREHNNLSVNAR